MNQVTIHGQNYEFYSWETLGDDIYDLSIQILKSGQEYDRIIALAKGGLTFSRSLVDFLDVKQVSSIQIEFYTGIGQTAKTPVITQSLPVSIRDERILIFDDIVDNGHTMKLAVEYLQYHGAKSIETSCLIKKPWSIFDVDYAARETEAWVIFPNEIRETIELLTNMWRDEHQDSDQKIKSQLLEIGFRKPEVAQFANLE